MPSPYPIPDWNAVAAQLSKDAALRPAEVIGHLIRLNAKRSQLDPADMTFRANLFNNLLWTVMAECPDANRYIRTRLALLTVADQSNP